MKDTDAVLPSVRKLIFSYNFLIVIMCCLIVMATSFVGAAVSTNYAVLRLSRGFSASQISYMTIVRALSELVIAMPIFEKAVCRFGMRKCLMLALFMEVIDLVLWSVAGSNIYIVYAGTLLAGIAMVFCGYMMIHTLIVNSWFRKNRGVMMGIIGAGTGMGSLIWAPVIQGMYDRFGDKVTFLLEAAIVAAIAVIAYVIIRNDPAELGKKPFGEDDPEETEKKKTVFVEQKGLKGKEQALLFMCAGIIGFCASPSSSNLSLNLITNGYAPVLVASGISVYGLVLMCSKIFFGRFKDRYGMMKAGMLFGGLQMTGLFLCALSRWINWEPFAFVCLIVYALGACIQMFSIVMWAEDFSDKNHYLRQSRKMNNGYIAGQLLGSLMVGLIADATGYYTMNYLIMAVLQIICFTTVTVLYIRRIKGKC